MATNSAEAIEKDEPPLTVSYHIEAKEEVPCNFEVPFGILNKYKNQLKRLRSGFDAEKIGSCSETKGDSSTSQVLSAESIVKIARMKQLQSDSQKGYNGIFTLSIAHEENAKQLKLVLCLLNAAEDFSRQKYIDAETSLSLILSASNPGHPIERVVTYFASDLRERIDLAKGIIDLEREVVHIDVDEAVVNLRAAIRACEQKLPFSQITHFTGIQTILDSVESAKRVHFIDLGIKLGSHWIVMMHALANREKSQLEQLKITAVGTAKDKIEEMGKFLTSFAESMNLLFKFIVLHSELSEVKKDMFNLEANEVVVVYMELCLMSLSSCPEKLESLVKEINCLNPYIMVVNDIEANVSGSTFTDRFYEALFLCSVMFDSQEACVERDDLCRKIIEQLYFQEIIKNCVMSLDESSFKQFLKIDFWREYFGRFGIVETELSKMSIYQANLLIKEWDCWRCCTLGMNGKSMLIGWNGTSFRSLSAWKFQK